MSGSGKTYIIGITFFNLQYGQIISLTSAKEKPKKEYYHQKHQQKSRSHTSLSVSTVLKLILTNLFICEYSLHLIASSYVLSEYGAATTEIISSVSSLPVIVLQKNITTLYPPTIFRQPSIQCRFLYLQLSHTIIQCGQNIQNILHIRPVKFWLFVFKMSSLIKNTPII